MESNTRLEPAGIPGCSTGTGPQLGRTDPQLDRTDPQLGRTQLHTAGTSASNPNPPHSAMKPRWVTGLSWPHHSTVLL